MKPFILEAFLALLLAASPTLAAPQDQTPTVLVQSVHRADLFDELTYPARVVPLINANVLAESDGVVARIAAPLGTRVKRRQSLMVIRHTDPVYQYAPLSVVGPVAGVVSGVDVTEGSLVAKGQKLASVTDPAQVRVVIEVAASDLESLKAGELGELTVNGRDKPVGVRVLGVSPFVDPATGTASCELAATERLAPGLVGQARFKVNAHQGFSLPDHAVVYRGDSTFVRVVEAGKARYLPVALGRKARGQVEIVKGLNEGARVIERASRFIADGEAVKAEEGAKL